MAENTALPEITDPFLLSVLRTTDALRKQTMALLDLTSKMRSQTSEQEAEIPAPLSSTSPEASQEASPEISPENMQILKGRKSMINLLSELRGQNYRLAHLARDTKAATSTSRAEVDQLHLSLQNLYYEQRHLMGEIASCESYPHAYAQLPLIPVEEFLEKFPEWKEKGSQESGPESGEEGLMRARIAEEKKEREELAQKVQALSRKKAELAQANAKKKQDLAKLDKDMEHHIQAVESVQKTFEKAS